MRGFKKDGKFIPTEKRRKSSLKKSDIGSNEHQTKKYVPIEERNKKTIVGYQDKRTPEAKENQHSIIERKGRDKETIGSHAGHPLVIEDNGKLYEEFPDHDEEVFKQPQSVDKHRSKFSLFGKKKSDQQKATEERIKNEGKTEKILEKQDKVQDKNNEKRAKEIAHHIKFLEKHMEGLEKKPAMFGVNANTQLENIQESRDQKRDLQAELDEINKLLEHPQVRNKRGIGKFTNLDYKQEREDAPFGDISAKEFTGRDKRNIIDTDEMKNLIHENQISSKSHDNDKRMKESIDDGSPLWVNGNLYKSLGNNKWKLIKVKK